MIEVENKERIINLKENEYQALFGVKKATFEKMQELLERTYAKEHRRGGRPPKLAVLDKLIITLSYYREYRPMQNIAFDYGVAKSTISESISWVEKSLIQCNEFHLPSKRQLLNNSEIELVIVDATECEIERPQKNKEISTPGRKRNTR